MTRMQRPDMQRPDMQRPITRRHIHSVRRVPLLACPAVLGVLALVSIAFATTAYAQRPAAKTQLASLDAPQNPLSPDALRARQELQQRARDLARELVGNMLDVQLKQLEQNGLQKLEIYRDIQTMRKHIDSLVEADMREVVALLVKAQQADPKDRGPLFTQARTKIRTIVTKLLAERQNLARRLRVAELAAQVRSLIEKQTNVRKTTESLSDQAQQRQVELALVTIQDQRDIKSLFIQLVASLKDVSGWGGELGAGAADGLRILQAGQAGKEVDNAGSSLESAKYAAAVKSQQLVINTLKALLDKLEGLQGLIGSSNEEALALVRDLEKREAEVRKETKQADLQDQPTNDKLVDQQTEIHKDLAKLNATLEKIPVAQAELEQAKAATLKATGDLFDAKQPDAVEQETKAIGDLAEIEHRLEQAGDRQTADKSAAELAKQLENLEKAQQQVAEAQKQEQQAATETKDKPQQAAGEDKHAAEELAKAAEPSPLPEAVKSRIEEAKEAAQDAAKADEAAATPAAKAAAQDAAQEAVDRAAAEIAAAINDTKLDQKAVSAGELARAAEALERAAAAEKQVAKETGDAAKNKGLTKDEAKKLADDQAEVKQVAEKVAEGVKDRSADAAAALDAAKAPIDDAGHDLVAAEKQPGDATKPADADAAKKADAAAGKLAEAAADLRKEVAKEAGELAQIADEQLKPVVERRQDVQAEQAKQPESKAAALENLKEAEHKVAAAQAAEQRAEGHPAAAAATELAQKIADAADAQKAADQAANDLAQGKADSSFDAATAEQKVADAAADAKKEAGDQTDAKSPAHDAVDHALDKAAQAAAEAAKQTVAGSPQAADAARQAARQALAEAEKAAQTEAQEAAQAPAGKPDPDAQKAVGQDAADAQKLAADAAPKAAEALDHAADASGQAEKALADKNQPAAAQAQQAADKGLDQAAKQIAQAEKDLAKQEAGEVGQHAGEIGQLAKNTAPVDPDAGSALHEAEKAAEQAGQGDKPQGDQGQADKAQADKAQGDKAQADKAQGDKAQGDKPQGDQGQADQPQGDQAQGDQGQAAGDKPADAAAKVGDALQKADASLAARQQRLENAKDLAQQIAADAQKQQDARNEIVADAAKLAEATADAAAQTPPAGQPAGDAPADHPAGQQQNAPPATPAQQSAAAALKGAEQKFADAQTQIGQNAEQVSGQTEVANQPIKEGLEAASQLGQGDQPAAQDQGQPHDAGQPEQGDHGQEAGDHGQEAGDHGQEAGDHGQEAGDHGQEAGEHGQGEHGQGQGDPAQALGTGIVPNAPEATAQQIAGPEANAEAAQAAGNEPGQGSEQGQGNEQGNEPGQEQGHGRKAESHVGNASAVGGGGAGVKSGQKTNNVVPPASALQNQQTALQPNDSRTPDDATKHEAELSNRAASKEAPWLAKLPPEVRNAIRAKAHKPAPKVYEDRLKNYFENIQDGK
ncbi:MAG TPA: hypothetical protein VHX65_03670 [Pirellulales bacterium]|nr:hypothetical protein [Pirellulales bacterium]